MLHLRTSCYSECTDHYASECRSNDPLILPATTQIHYSPGHNDEKADVWQIGVSVRHRLTPYLNDPDHRDQHPNVPKPTGEYVRGLPLMGCPKSKHGDQG